MALYVWEDKKNQKLKRERNVGFEAVVTAIQEGDVVDDYPHPNRKKYAHQRLMVVIIDAYAYLVPYIDKRGTLVLKTVIPSRKATKRYIKKGGV